MSFLYSLQFRFLNPLVPILIKIVLATYIYIYNSCWKIIDFSIILAHYFLHKLVTDQVPWFCWDLWMLKIQTCTFWPCWANIAKKKFNSAKKCIFLAIYMACILSIRRSQQNQGTWSVTSYLRYYYCRYQRITLETC